MQNYTFDNITDYLKSIFRFSNKGKFLKEQGFLKKTRFYETDETPCLDVEKVLVDMLESLIRERDRKPCEQ